MSAEGATPSAVSPMLWADGYPEVIVEEEEEPIFPAFSPDSHPTTPPAVSPSDIPFHYDERYAFSDADIVIVPSVDQTSGWGDPDTRFKAHKRKLRAASVIFSDMLDCGNDDLVEGDELPEVRLPESVQAIAVLLGAVYCDQRDKIVPLESLDWKIVKEVWEAGKKYELHMLAAYAGDILVWVVPLTLIATADLGFIF